MTDPFFDPCTGELLPDADLPTLNRVIDAAYAEVDRLQAAIRPLRDRRDVLRPRKVGVPRRSAQTDTQMKATRCPRCHGRYTEPAEAAS